LKVLPEEPDHPVPSKTTRTQEPADDSEAAVSNERATDTGGEASDEEEGESEELQDQEDVEVR